MSMFENLLPRHLEIIYTLNQKHLDVSLAVLAGVRGVCGVCVWGGGVGWCSHSREPALACSPSGTSVSPGLCFSKESALWGRNWDLGAVIWHSWCPPSYHLSLSPMHKKHRVRSFRNAGCSSWLLKSWLHCVYGNPEKHHLPFLCYYRGQRYND